MKTFTTTVEIAASPERTWRVMIDVARWHEWTASVTSITLLDEGPLRVGSRAVVRQPRLPPAVWKVTAIDAGRRFTWVNAAPGLLVVGHHSVEPTGSGCRASLTLELRGLMAGMFAWFTGRLTERYLALEAAGLKRRSEDPAFHHSSSEATASLGAGGA